MRTALWKSASVIGIMAGLLSLGVSAGIYAEDIVIIDEADDLEDLVPIEISEDMVVPDDGSVSEDIVESEGPDPYESVEGLIEDNTGEEEALFAAADIKETGTCGDNLTWTLDTEGLLTISGTGPMEDYTGYGKSPFYDRDDIRNVVIEDGATSIGNNVFNGCSEMISVTIPESVTSIGRVAFCFCSRLPSVTIPDSVTYIGESAFKYCDGLTSINIPASVTTIGESAFSSCDGLTSINIPASVTTIRERTFYGCDSLISVVIHEGVESIGDNAFGCCDNLWSVVIPDSVTHIHGDAFFLCDALKCFVVSDIDAFKEKFPKYNARCFTMSEKEEVDSVILLIDSLPSTTTYADREAVENARAAYDALTKKQQNIISQITLNKLKDAEAFLNHTHDSNNKTYTSCDNEYHIVCFTCKVCGEYFEIKERHNINYFRYHGPIKVDNYYHAGEYECSDCGANAIDTKSKHNYSSGDCIKKATLTTKGVMKYKCIYCGASKNVAISWKLYDDNSISYEPWNASIYNNAKKITVYLANPLKGSVLKVKVGKKTYTKKINNYTKKIKIKIKKAKYGSKINIQLLYNGRVVGRSETDYVWYAKKMRNGMTKKQARWTWGSPDDTSSASGGWSYWYYSDGSYIGFRSGRVRYWYDAEG